MKEKKKKINENFYDKRKIFSISIWNSDTKFKIKNYFNVYYSVGRQEKGEIFEKICLSNNRLFLNEHMTRWKKN